MSLTLSCVDRIAFDVKQPDEFPLTISGHITNLRGPYTVKIIRAYDIDSRDDLRTPVSVNRVTILDDQGNSEDLTEDQIGMYHTDPDGMRGVVGRVYRLRVELRNGEVVESTPDTLLAPGKLDTTYYRFEKTNFVGPSEYAFKVLFSGTNAESNANFFQWRFIGTFKVNTVPEEDPNHIDGCYAPDCPRCNACNITWRCSGLRNFGTIARPSCNGSSLARAVPVGMVFTTVDLCSHRGKPGKMLC